MDPETYNSALATPLALATLLKQKLHTLKDILNEFGDLDQVQFDLFQPKACTKARANLPHLFLS
jgi:hypothetical protein